jgi:putative glutathione S-transferase
MVEEIHKYGTDDGWHGVIQEGGQFPPEEGRYHLYIGISSLIRLVESPKFAH